ncbi:maleylpyruvate isomerase N-terminal domain-containing protein [Saccharothrix sp. HUAS TT1]|uniref:maleylpyruvate isomerase N-terminal domain-containing protein n=1 Tax=unclassified Saccharothrix TaxID=2593673 RepID=UPI00345BF396
MTFSWAALPTSAAAEAIAVLEKGADQDWNRPAGDTHWSCRGIVDHILLGVVGYAGLLIAQPANRYMAVTAGLNRHASIPECLEALAIANTFVASAVREATPEARAFHPYGTSDRTGFAAMAALETLVHSHDIVRTLGFDWTPSDELSAPVVERLFPEAPTGHPAGLTLLWATGRIPLPGVPQRPREGWRWDGSVRD